MKVERTSHTPGPWSWKEAEEEFEVFFDDSGDGISDAVVHKTDAGSDDENEGLDREAEVNVCLIAAAPELLAALEDILGVPRDVFSEDLGDGQGYQATCRWCGRDYTDDEEVEEFCPADDCPGYKARAAVAKARGLR